MTHGCVVVINGYPGVGKHTVANELVKVLPNSRVLDTHQLDTLAGNIHAPNTTEGVELRKALRETIILSILPDDPSPHHPGSPRPGETPPILLVPETIFTSPLSSSLLTFYLTLTQTHHLSLVHLILSASSSINITRFTDPLRGGVGKVMDEDALVGMRMEEEIAHYVSLKDKARGNGVSGVAGEYEIETSGLGVKESAGMLGEYCQEALRGEGWFFQLNRRRR